MNMDIVKKTVFEFMAQEQEILSRKGMSHYQMVQDAVKQIHEALSKTHPINLDEGSIVYDEEIMSHKIVINGNFVAVSALIEHFKEHQYCQMIDCMGRKKKALVTCYTCSQNLCEHHAVTEEYNQLDEALEKEKLAEKIIYGVPKVINIYFCQKCFDEYKKGEE